MKNTFFLVGTLLVSGLNHLTAQETPSITLVQPQAIKKVDVCEVSILGGFMIGSSQYVSIADYSKLAPESKLLKADLSQYIQSESYAINGSGNFSVLLGMRFGKKDGTAYKPNPILRAGFSYFNSANFSSGLYQSTNKRYDTLLSYQTGTEIFVDSVSQRNYNMMYNSQQIRLDLSLIFRTDGKARWSFYSGIGLNAGVSLNAKTQINYSNYAYTETDGKTSASTNQASSYPFYVSFYNSAPPESEVTSYTETFRNKNNTAFSAYVPLGVDFRIGKKRAFWKRTHLFCEFRPGINSTSIPELGTFNSAYWQTNFGVKINWENM